MAGAYALELAMGWVTVTDALVRPEGQPFVAAILADVIVVVGIAGWEEMAFRGYPIKNLAEGLYGNTIGATWATVLAVLIPSMLFGWLHSSNADATTLSVLNTVLFGTLFGAAYVLTGELALPLGLHFSWDFAQAFGLGRSGDVPRSGAFLVIEETDPETRLWTGWPFTVEGGLLGTGTLVLGFVLVVAWVRYRRGSVGVHPSLIQMPSAA
jgi:uncharacterized protein